MDNNDLFANIEKAMQYIVDQNPNNARQVLANIKTTCISNYTRLSASPELQFSIFKRDSFICRYCGSKTLFIPVLRAVSELLPDAFPYHLHWKLSDCHVAYWQYGASIDHVIPVARGGSSKDECNLVTSCYKCNSIKNYWLLEELRWSLQPAANDDWDGLSSMLKPICESNGLSDSKYFRQWIRVLQANS
ncbi:MAG: HNH endonuclease [Armatimonadota bacterium]